MIKIVVDSGSDSRMELGICDQLVPITVSIAGRDYQDGVDITADRFYELLMGTGEFPKTSQPSPENYLEIFEKAKQAGEEVLCFTLSSALSGTYQSAVIAQNMVSYEGIHVIDTRKATHLIGFLTGYAKKRAEAGIPAARITAECEELKDRIRVFAGLDTLEYLYKGGRLSRVSAAVGQLAGIKPVVTVPPEGTVSVVAKAIGVPRAIQTILSKVTPDAIDQDFPIISLYSCGTGNTEKLEQKLRDAGVAVTERVQIGPTIGAHIGPNVYGVAYVEKA